MLHFVHCFIIESVLKKTKNPLLLSMVVMVATVGEGGGLTNQTTTERNEGLCSCDSDCELSPFVLPILPDATLASSVTRSFYHELLLLSSVFLKLAWRAPGLATTG